MKAARIARLFGIDVAVDASWTVIAVLVTWVLFAELWLTERDTGGVALLGLAVGGAIAFFGCLVAHELSHSLVAVRRGMRVRRIRLFIFGGVSEIEQEAGTPRDELLITVAGPVMSLALAGGFLALALAVPESLGALHRLFELLALVNLALGVFNLAPGFPLDGGRVLRAAVWHRTGDYRKATAIAVNAGRVLAMLLAVVGVLVVVADSNIAGLWWVAIGWFLFRAAGASLRRLDLEDALRGLAAGDVMVVSPAVVTPAMTLDEIVADHSTAGRPFTVMVAVAGRVHGLVDSDVTRQRPSQTWSHTTAASVMTPITPADVISADTAATDLLPRISGPRQRFVVVRDGRMVGLLSSGDLLARGRRRRLR